MNMGNHGLAYWPYCKKTLAASSTLSMAQTFLPISHRRHKATIKPVHRHGKYTHHFLGLASH